MRSRISAPTTAFGKRPERRWPTIFTRTTIASREVIPARGFLQLALIALLACLAAHASAADRVIIGNVSRTVEQLPNYAATDKGFFAQQEIQGDVVLIGSTDTLIQALIAGPHHMRIGFHHRLRAEAHGANVPLRIETACQTDTVQNAHVM